MARKIVPNTQNNLTLGIVLFLVVVVAYLWYRVSYLGNNQHHTGILPPNHSQHVSVTNALAKIPMQDVRGDVGRCSATGGTVGDPLTNALN